MLDRGTQDSLETGMEALELGPFEPPSPAPGADSCPKEALVRINIANSLEQFLVEERQLDGQLAAAKQLSEVFNRNRKRLPARAVKSRGFFPGRVGFSRRVVNSEPTEAPRIDKTQFAPRAKRENGMSMRGRWNIGRRDE